MIHTVCTHADLSAKNEQPHRKRVRERERKKIIIITIIAFNYVKCRLKTTVKTNKIEAEGNETKLAHSRPTKRIIYAIAVTVFVAHNNLCVRSTTYNSLAEHIWWEFHLHFKQFSNAHFFFSSNAHCSFQQFYNREEKWKIKHNNAL